MSISIAIVEDNPELCEELQQVVAEEDSLKCVAACRNATSALKRLPAALPDVVLMDIRLPDGSGIELVQKLSQQLPKTQFVMLTMYQDNKHIFDALGVGAVGYLLKDASSEEIVAAIHDAHAGKSPLSGTVARKVVTNLQSQHTPTQQSYTLTARECDVMEQVAKGLADKQIADQLGISLTTVNTHLKNIYAKLDVHSRSEAISRYFMQNG
ncbi:response regulator transcription factor [Pelagicoccus enzymogenes]|uniref:response regulator transcription factor n=1 Tax=Pelagicoccus enzymogenes TaxID=2773457 RepID=UPI0028107937|nr:response regulator transcription factor [Pelagicoccus enzymogenes]MDQ8199651.1 response regulator transcription factor [Pelagicoccus enzymogenes]